MQQISMAVLAGYTTSGMGQSRWKYRGNLQPFYQRLSEVVGKCLFSAESGQIGGKSGAGKSLYFQEKLKVQAPFYFRVFHFMKDEKDSERKLPTCYEG